MRLRLKTYERKVYNRVQKLGHWHRKFIVWPRVHLKKSGLKEFIFLEFVYRKAVWDIWYNQESQYRERLYVREWKYNTEDNVVYEALAAGDELEFDSDEAKLRYHKIRYEINEE